MGAAPRRAVVLFVPPPASDEIDEIRRRWDPVMCERIGPHVTLVHDVVDHGRATELVRTAAAATAPFPIRLAGTGHWGRSAFGVYLDVADPTGTVAALHRRLAEIEEPRWARVPFRAHCTLVHSRTTPPEIAAQAWATLDGFDGGWDVELAALEVVELDDATGWTTVDRIALGSTLVTD